MPASFSFDIRTKIMVTATLGTLLVTNQLEQIFPCWYLSLYLLPLIILLGDRRFKLAAKYMLLILLLGAALWFLINHKAANILPPWLQFVYGFLIFICYFISKILPALFIGYYLIFYSEVNDFILAMEKLRLPPVLIIPVAVIFRFLPTFRAEKQAIAMAMKMRGLTGINRLLHPLNTFKFLFIPLLMNSLRIADDLAIAAMTKGLSLEKRRTSLHNISLSITDYLLLFSALGYWLLFFYSCYKLRL